MRAIVYKTMWSDEEGFAEGIEIAATQRFRRERARRGGREEVTFRVFTSGLVPKRLHDMRARRSP